MQREECFKEIFYKNYNVLCNVAYNYLSDYHLAEDIAQNTLINFWESGKDSLPQKEASYYLVRAVKNNCISYLRKHKYNLSLDDQAIGEYNLNLAYEEDEDNNDNETIEHLYKAIQKLPLKCRNVFLLSKKEQMKNKEIAEHLGISIKTVEGQMSKAIKILRKYFQDYVALWVIIERFVLPLFNKL